MEIKGLVLGQKVWTMIGNYPYEVEIVDLRPCKVPKPWGTYQYDSVRVWRKSKETDTVHKRRMYEIFESREDIKRYLFPE